MRVNGTFDKSHSPCTAGHSCVTTRLHHPSQRWIQAELVPRIPDALLQSVGFLYSSSDAALNGERAGGTAFLVEVSAAGEVATFVVTNIHVAAGGCHSLRLSRRDSGIQVLDVSDWMFHPDGDDVAVARIDLPEDRAEFPLLWTDIAASRPRLDELNAGVGDEVLMIGRFIAHDGRVRNAPLARFGNIAMMPGEPVMDGRGMKVEAFLVEMRSLSGFSGSPVFVYMGPGTYRGDGRMMPFYTETIGLIGIDTGHKVVEVAILDSEGQETEFTAAQNSGVAVVAPIWKVGETLSEALGAEVEYGA